VSLLNKFFKVMLDLGYLVIYLACGGAQIPSGLICARAITCQRFKSGTIGWSKDELLMMNSREA
jgi:hypothetical protein